MSQDGEGNGASGTTDTPEESNDTELTKSHFEYFKHFTTLSATAAVGVVTLKDIADIGRFYVVSSLVAFGITLLISVSGLNISLIIMRRGETSQEDSFITVLALLISLTFVVGLIAFTWPTFRALPSGIPWLVLGIYVVSAVFLIHRYRD
jgi:uncharacterized BrkB/YihY/UPF0761 family membrane protein